MRSRLSLRMILLADAALTGATGLLMAAGAWFLNDLLDMPVNLIWISGIVLIAYAGLLVAIRRRNPINPMLVESFAAINLAWGVGCVILLLAGWTNANALGIAFVLLQIVVVAFFAALQLNATRRETKRGIVRLTAN